METEEEYWGAEWRRYAHLSNLDDPTAEEDYERRKLEDALLSAGIERFADQDPTPTAA